MISNRPQKIRNAEQQVRNRRRHRDGSIEDVPNQIYAKYVNPSGHVMSVVLDYDPMRRNPDSDYGALKRRSRHRAGMVRYDECPIVGGHADMFPGETPCTDFIAEQRARRADQREDYCCKHVQALIDDRRAAHEKRSQEFARQTAGISEKLREEQREFQAELVSRIETAMTANRKKGQGG